MRIEQAQTEGSKNLLVSVVMDLALIVAALLSMGSAPTMHATSSVEAAKPKAVAFASTTPDSIFPREAIADRDVLDLQLD